MSVAFLLTAAAVVVAGYHVGRGRFTGRPGRRAPAPGRTTRPYAWIPTARIMAAVALLLVALFAAAYSAGA
ncbi:hypothetical protein [Actinoplanes sp. M2I2]|uniref:hypothetical protein n=1 Tax=Actinoplanes sp. M2I2 TaxID=1734444 RepID=UPI0020224305|nr:hypothetical protein [Actinoplanes sp. M2I2]